MKEANPKHCSTIDINPEYCSECTKVIEGKKIKIEEPIKDGGVFIRTVCKNCYYNSIQNYKLKKLDKWISIKRKKLLRKFKDRYWLAYNDGMRDVQKEIKNMLKQKDLNKTST